VSCGYFKLNIFKEVKMSKQEKGKKLYEMVEYCKTAESCPECPYVQKCCNEMHFLEPGKLKKMHKQEIQERLDALEE
jgi:hypothetical protein